MNRENSIPLCTTGRGAWRSLGTAILLIAATTCHAQLVDVTRAKGLGEIRLSAGHEWGGGGIFTDLDADGYPDLVLPGGPGQPTMIYHNTEGRIPSERVFEGIVLGGSRAYGATGAVAGDYDGDGDLDIYVTTHSATMVSPCVPTELCSPNILYENFGNMQFFDVTNLTRVPGQQNGVPNTGVSHSIWSDDEEPYYPVQPIVLDNAIAAAWADVDRDGDLDLYVANHDGTMGNPDEDPVTYGQRDILFLNRGDGTFEDATETYGVCGFIDCEPDRTSGRLFGSAIAAVFTDLDNDRWPDLIVINKTGGLQDRDLYYRNLGEDASGTWRGFEPRPLMRPTQAFSTAVSLCDSDNDGDVDFFKSSEGAATFYENHASTSDLGFTASLRGDLGSATGMAWVDLDNNGLEDMYVGRGNGLNDLILLTRLSGISAQLPVLTSSTGPTKTVLTADYDRDGDMDLFTIRLNRVDHPADNYACILWENRIAEETANGYLSLRLRGNPALTDAPYPSRYDALGARVTLVAMRGHRAITRQNRMLGSSNGFAASSNDSTLHFGVGEADRIDITIHWPSGRTTSIGGIPPKRFLEITERDAR